VSAPLNIGIVGLGFGSQVHIPAFRCDPRCRVAAIAGRNPEKAASIARKRSVEISHGDWRYIVDDPNIDAVSIAVPPFEQAAIAKAAIEASKHVFCEKPLAASEAEAVCLFKAAEAKRIVHAIDFIFPELPLWLKARDLIGGGELGQIRHAVLNWRVETYAARVKAQSWKNNSTQGGGVLNNFVSHVVHNIAWFFGEIESVSAALRGLHCSAETCVQATLDMQAGFPVFLSVASDAFLGDGHCLAVYAEEGTLVLENRTPDYASGFELRMGTRATGRLQLIGRDDRESGVDGRVAPVARLASRFLDAILNGVEMSPNFAEGLRAQSILDEMRASNRIDRRPLKIFAPHQ
jgi:predicted dehydrogenase